MYCYKGKTYCYTSIIVDSSPCALLSLPPVKSAEFEA